MVILQRRKQVRQPFQGDSLILIQHQKPTLPLRTSFDCLSVCLQGKKPKAMAAQAIHGDAASGRKVQHHIYIHTYSLHYPLLMTMSSSESPSLAHLQTWPVDSASPPYLQRQGWTKAADDRISRRSWSHTKAVPHFDRHPVRNSQPRRECTRVDVHRRRSFLCTSLTLSEPNHARRSLRPTVSWNSSFPFWPPNSLP